MAQLVGQMCVICRARIGNALESRFCPSCGCPVHTACATATAVAPEGACHACGAPAAEVAPRRTAAEVETVRPPGDWTRAEALVLRYVLGVLLFGGLVVFVTPTELAVVLSQADRSGDPGGLLSFGLTCATVLGLPGYFAFPYRRRFQAVAWLALACMGYSLLLFGALTLLKAEPRLVSSPGGREFIQGVTIHYDRLLAITAVQFAVWAALVRKSRG